MVIRSSIDNILIATNGTNGQPGTPGTSSYIHIKYSNDGGQTFTANDGETIGAYIGIYKDYTEADSSSVSDYQWKKIEGEDGESAYTIMLSNENFSISTDISYVPIHTQNFTCNVTMLKGSSPADFTITASTDTENDIVTTVNGHTVTIAVASAEALSAPQGVITLTITTIDGQNTHTFTKDITWSVAVQGQDGQSGAAGVSITDVTNYYLATLADSGVTKQTTGWTTTIQNMTENDPYLWNYEVITGSNGQTISSTEPVIIGRYGRDGDAAAEGRGIYSIAEHYQTSSSNTTPPSTWSDTPVATDNTNKYLWNYETITYTDNTSEDTQKRVIGTHGTPGGKGDTGRGIASITEYFLLSDTDDASKITFPEVSDKHGWTTVGEALIWSKNKPYLWHCTEVVYENPSSTVYIDKYCDTSWKAADLVQSNLTDFQQGVDQIVDRDNQSIRSAVWENTYTYKPKKDAQGNYIYDEHGKIVPDTDNTTSMAQYMAETIYDMDGIISRVSSSESSIDSLGSRVSTAESTITQHATDIEAKVSKDGVIAAINLSTETEDGSTAKISADKVEINGTAIFNSISSDVNSAIESKGYATTTQAQGYADTAQQNAIDQIPTDISELNNDSGYQTASDVNGAISTATADIATNTSVSNTYATKTNAINRQQRIYYRKTTSGAPAKNTTWLASSGTGYGNWSLNIPQLTDSNGTKYPYLYTAVQTQTVAQQASSATSNNCSCSDVLIDGTATIIDGGTIITGTVTAREITTDNLQGDHGWINLKDGKFYYGDESTFAASDNAISWNGSKLQIKADEFLLASGKSIFDEVEAIETWFYATAPTTSNEPAKNWTTDNLKKMHLRDIYFDTNSGKSYRWAIDGTTYKWVEIEDKELSALAGRVATAETNISTNSEQIALRATKTEIANTYATKDSVPTSVTDLSDADNYATKDYADGAADTAEANAKADTTTKLQSYYTKTETDSAITQSAEEITSKVTKLETRSVGNYATSSTGAGTTAKVATIVPAVTGWELYKGAVMTVKFTAANTASAPTLNVNSTGAKPIKTYSGGNLSEAEYKWDAGTTMSFVYDGTNWRIQDSSELTRLKSAETNISQNAEAISLRATKTEAQGYATTAETNAKNDTTNKLKSYSTTTEMNAVIEAKADEITSSVSTTYATKTSVPTKTSDLTNDSNFATESYADGKASSAESAAKTYADGKASDAETAAKGYADTQIGTAKTEIKQTTDSITQRIDKTDIKIAGNYATSSTAASTKAKVATIIPQTDNWELYNGAVITVKFTNANTNSAPTLNINSTGNKNIKTYSGGNLSESEYKWDAGSTMSFVYDGTNWRIQDSTELVRIKNAESSITQTATSIESIVSANDTYTKPDGTTATNTLKSLISQNTTAIEAKVDNNGVIAAINLSTETEGGSTAKIHADKVNIEGAAIFTSGRLSSDNLNDTIDGRIPKIPDDISDLTDSTGVIPTSTSDLTNDSGFQTANDVKGTIVSNVTLYYASNSTTPPSKPTSHVSTNNANTRGEWNIALPTYNANYPYLYTCTELQTKSGTYSWTSVEQSTYASVVSSIQTTANNAAPKSSAVAKTQRIYYRSNSSTKPTAYPTAWVKEEGNKWNSNATTADGWSRKVTPISDGTGANVTKYLYLWTATQKQMVNGTVATLTADDIALDDSTTVIDGGKIITGSVTANQLNAADINASKSLTVGAFQESVQDDILNSNIQVGGRNLLRHTKDFAESTYTSTCTFEKDSEGITVITFPEYTGSVGWHGVTLHPNIPYTLIRNKTVTLSFWYRSDSWTLASGGHNIPLPSFEILANATDNPSGAARLKYQTIYDSTVPAPTTEWQRFVRTYNITDSFFTAGSGTVTEDRYFTIQMFQHNLSHLQYKKIQLEIGNKVTDWTPAPEDVQDNVDNIRLTGKNLLTGTNTVTAITSTGTHDNRTWRKGGDGTGTITHIDVEDAPYNVIKNGWKFDVTSVKTTNYGSGLLVAQNAANVVAGKTYTMSCYAKGTGTLYMFCGITSYIPSDGSGKITVTSSWQKYSVTFTAPSNTAVVNANGTNVFFGASGTNISLSICGMMLEEGNTATLWSPAPEDITYEEQRIYYRSKVSTKPNGNALPTAWVTNTANKWNSVATNADGWSRKVTPISNGKGENVDKFLYLFTCTQSRSVSGNVTYSEILLDDSTTVIDGGNIITHSITATQIDADSINASKSLTVGAFDTTDADTQSSIMNSAIQIGGRNILYDTNAPSLIPTGVGGGIRYFSDAATLSVNGEGTEWTKLPDSPISEVKYGAKHVCTQTGGKTHFVGFYQGADRVDFVPGCQYTVSFWVKSEVADAIVKIDLSTSDEWDRTEAYSYTIHDINVWEKVSVSFTYLGTDELTAFNQQNTILYIGFAYNVVGTVWCCGYQVEVGNMATNWSEYSYTQTSFGGRNLIRNTNIIDLGSNATKPNINGYYNDGSHYGNIENGGGTLSAVEHGVKITATGNASYALRFGTATTNATNILKADGLYGLEAGATYTLSFDTTCKIASAYTGSDISYLGVYLYGDIKGDGTLGNENTWNAEWFSYPIQFYPWEKGTEKEGHVVFTFTIPNDATRMYLIIRPGDNTASYVGAGDFIEMRNIKLERGNHATDYSPAPEDIGLQFDEVNNRVDVLDSFQSGARGWMEFKDAELTIGKKVAGSDDIFCTVIDGTQMAFKQNDDTVAYISNKELSITNANISGNLTIGKFLFRPHENEDGGMSLIWS